MLRYITLLIIPILAFASSSEAEPEMLKRTINFLLFAGLLYYILVNKFKIQNFFKNRKNTIADKLNAIQEKLKESKNRKVVALEKLEESKANAKSFIITSEKEGRLLSAKIAADLDGELEGLEKSYKDQMNIERRKMVREVVSEVLDDLFSENSINIDRDKFINIILKKVA